MSRYDEACVVSSYDDTDEEIEIETLSVKFLSSFKINEKVTVTVKGPTGTSSLSGKVERLQAPEDYETYDYNSAKGTDKKVTKTRVGKLCIKVGSGPEPIDEMMDAFDGDDD